MRNARAERGDAREARREARRCSTPPAVRAEEPHIGDDAVGGLLIDTHGFVAASDLTRALSPRRAAHGAQVVEQSRVQRITTRARRHRRRHQSRIADRRRGRRSRAGSWSGEIAIDGVSAPVPVRPVRGSAAVARRGSATALRRVTWTRRCYFVPWDDGTLLVGATVEEAGFDERATVAGVRDLLDAACEIVPHAWTAGFRGARVGLRPATATACRSSARLDGAPNVVYATGHYRNGVLLAPLTAQLVADAGSGRRLASTLLDRPGRSVRVRDLLAMNRSRSGDNIV